MFVGNRLMRIFLAPLLGSLVLLGVGCFGGGGENFELMTFEDSGTEITESAAIQAPVVHDVAVAPLIREELNYLYRHRAWVNALVTLNRDMMSLAEESETESGLEWVIGVHEVTREADDLFALVLGTEIPETQIPAHFEVYLGTVETIQLMVYGSDRLLASALVLGPSGRVVGDLAVEEGVRYRSLMDEANFYLGRSENSLDDNLEDVNDALSAVSLR